MNSKLITIVTVAALLFSCSAMKTARTDRTVINTYLEKVMYSKDYAIIFVLEEPLSTKKAFAVYETGYRESKLTNNPYVQVYMSPALPNWPLDEKEIIAIKNKIGEAPAPLWKPNDFNDSRIVIKDQKTLNSTDFVVKYVPGNNVVLRLSKPIYSSDKQYVLFECGISPILGEGYFPENGIVLMKKQGRKWKQVTLFNRDPYYYYDYY